MTYKELLANIRDLGFSDDAEMAEFGELVPNAINRAITEISEFTDPIIERYEFELDDEDEGYVYISMPEVDPHFFAFSDTPVLYEKDGTQMYKPFIDYEVEAEDTVVVNADENKGKFRICYIAEHTYFTGTEADNDKELPLPRAVHHLVPLLASYYVWLEDEMQKAVMYYNLYEQESAAVRERRALEKNKIKMRVLSGGI